MRLARMEQRQGEGRQWGRGRRRVGLPRPFKALRLTAPKVVDLGLIVPRYLICRFIGAPGDSGTSSVARPLARC